MIGKEYLTRDFGENTKNYIIRGGVAFSLLFGGSCGEQFQSLFDEPERPQITYAERDLNRDYVGGEDDR